MNNVKKTHSRNILVVGAANGIGKSTVDSLLAKGYEVAAADCDIENLKKLQILNSDKALHLLELDITKKESITSAKDWVKENFSQLDNLVITAGRHNTCPVEYLSDETIDSLFQVNLVGHIKLVRDFLPLISSGGKIIGVSSLAGCIGIPLSSIYSSSKFGLEGFYEVLALEARFRNIYPVLIEPGNVNTGFNEKGNDYDPKGIPFIDEAYKRVLDKIHSRHGISPDYVASTILKVLEIKKPRLAYLAGFNAKKAYYARNVLGRTIARSLVAQHFGISNS
jgi:short-subunit dehydrogenase